ncbi:hypothetical protein [Ornithinibacillus scapharcae]|uniref:hypothetical protein n=1 Tax=Ornithinibacillus scapharcae TaxID=1147159 RepID=UPI000225B9FC|nr:hypothetical protein [Ornithinibacillus scapharcae]
MEKETSNKGAWLFVLALTIILVVGLILNQPMKKEDAIEAAKEFVSAEFDQVHSTKFIPMNQNELGADLWEIELNNEEADIASLVINAHNGNLVEGSIIDGKTKEILEEL